MDKQIQLFKLCEETHQRWYEALHLAHDLERKLKRLLKSLQSPLGIDYKKYSSEARRKARVILGKKNGYEIDHKISLKLCWVIGIPLEEVNRKENLAHVRRSKNRRKSFLVNWKEFGIIFPEYEDLI